VSDLLLVPDLVGRCLDREPEVLEVAGMLKDVEHMLYLGRGY
jgi:glutamine---fructose-6-phosphate transaminase (isomerizing)